MPSIIRGPRLRALLGLVPLLFALVVCACSVSQTVVVKSDGSGTLTMHVEMSTVLHDYIASLSEATGQKAQSPSGQVFNPDDIRKSFAAQQGITVQKVSSPSPNILDVSLAFTSLGDVFSQNKSIKGTGALLYTDTEGTRTIRLHLDRTNYTQLSAVFPLLADPMIASMGPQVNDKISDSEYLEMIKFTLGDEAPGLVQKSFVTITIKPEGQILSQTGGTLSGGAVVFKIPLLRLLVLDKPLDYTVSFK